MQRTGRRDFEAVIVHREPHRTAARRIVPVAQGVRRRFSCRERRVERLVDTLDAARIEPARDGKCVAQKAFGVREQHERVAIELPVVQEFASVGTPETRHAKQALRQLEFEALRPSEQRPPPRGTGRRRGAVRARGAGPPAPGCPARSAGRFAPPRPQCCGPPPHPGPRPSIRWRAGFPTAARCASARRASGCTPRRTWSPSCCRPVDRRYPGTGTAVRTLDPR